MDESSGTLPHDDWCHDEPAFDFDRLKAIMEEEIDRGRELLMMGVCPAVEHVLDGYVAFVDKALFDLGGKPPVPVLEWMLRGWQHIADFLLQVKPMLDLSDHYGYNRFLELGTLLATLAVNEAGGDEELAA
jgi:hypothetical protein